MAAHKQRGFSSLRETNARLSFQTSTELRVWHSGRQLDSLPSMLKALSSIPGTAVKEKGREGGSGGRGEGGRGERGRKEGKKGGRNGVPESWTKEKEKKRGRQEMREGGGQEDKKTEEWCTNFQEAALTGF